jgi:hypothetical protein
VLEEEEEHVDLVDAGLEGHGTHNEDARGSDGRRGVGVFQGADGCLAEEAFVYHIFLGMRVHPEELLDSGAHASPHMPVRIRHERGQDLADQR